MWVSFLLVPDHPRSRGEYPRALTRVRLRAGSSPLSRGILDGDVFRAKKDRIIPALAGNTSCGMDKRPPTQDHPRSRGEYRVFLPHGARPSGSSPLSRGIHAVVSTLSDASRIIPALAGNTVPPARPSSSAADHPRSRGEYGRSTRAWRSTAGSSPLSRGILRRRRRLILVPGIIPALAGNTRHSTTGPQNPRDHPRSRGEYTQPCSATDPSMGSSPLSRGILWPAV